MKIPKSCHDGTTLIETKLYLSLLISFKSLCSSNIFTSQVFHFYGNQSNSVTSIHNERTTPKSFDTVTTLTEKLAVRVEDNDVVVTEPMP